MSKFSIQIILTTVASLALGIALYFVFLHMAAHGPVTAEPGVTGKTLSPQSSDGAVRKPHFRFQTHPQPRDLPDIAMVAGDGQPLTLKAFRGKLVLVNIWATWCGPCREEMPALDRLQAQLGGPGFQVLPLSIDREGPSIVKKFYQELGLQSLGIYVDSEMRANALLSVVGVPTTLLISASGQELGRVLGPAQWDSPEVVREIQRYLGKSPPGGG